MADLFISSRSADLSAARAIRRELEADGYSCWMFTDDPMRADTWAESVMAEINACRAMVLVMSRDAIDSPRIAQEVNLGTARGKSILPVRIEDVRPQGTLEYMLALVRPVDAFPPPVEAYGESIRMAVRSLLRPRKAQATEVSETTVGGTPAGERLTVFISYRRKDTGGWALPLYEELVARFGRDSVFMDVDAIEPGEDWRDRIDGAIHASDVVLVLVGPWWGTIADASGKRRLDAEEDRLRAEIAASLVAPGKRVIPVLVGGAGMPPSADLPDDIRGLARRQAVTLSPTSYRADVDRLVKLLGDLEDRKRGTA